MFRWFRGEFHTREMNLTMIPVLIAALLQSTTFAGHFTIVIWGCGASCQQFAIVDASSGRVFFSNEVPYVSFGDWEGEPYGLDFQKNSRLLAVYGHIKEDDPKGIFYYTWDGTRLTPVKSIPKK
jgi:hypothetical protein